MIEDVFVVDAVAHGVDLTRSNWRNDDVCEPFARHAYSGVMQLGVPKDQPEYLFDHDRYLRGETGDPDVLAAALFGESWTDAAIYHGVPLFGFLKEGLSPLRNGVALRERFPHRVSIFGPISPFEPDPIGEVDRLVEEVGVDGLKFYPVDQYGTEVRSFRMDDPAIVYPILERAQHHGLRAVAVHKALPLGRFPTDPFNVTDLDNAFREFPDLNIEITHGGMAFLDETAMQVRRFQNAWVNLEATGAMLVKAPQLFMDILGKLLAAGGEDRIVWGSGCTTHHPQPLLERFWDLEFPDEMVEGYGVPQLTREIKAKILGGNVARLHGFDIEQMKRDASQDVYGLDQPVAPPWSTPAGVVGSPA